MMSRTLRLSDGSAVRMIEAGHGAPLVLLHGVGLCAEAWGPQIDGLARDRRVLALDLPGHGGTDPLTGRPDLQAYVKWAARVMSELVSGSASIAGHSMGALIALGLAVDHPALVRRFALLNVVHRRNAAARSAVKARADALEAGRVDVAAPLSRWFGPGEEAVRQKVGRWLSDTDPHGYAAAYRAFADGDATYADQVGCLACPVLVLTGAGDPNSTTDMARAIAATAPQGRALVIDGHRHMVNLTAPERITAALADWLAVPVPAESVPT
ncbi:MAG: alpha/beta fold hydrolase [Rubellimicrobium sp.]|nr:alpha/beta fold hydrolase [Rubellimicrobium sp.]